MRTAIAIAACVSLWSGAAAAGTADILYGSIGQVATDVAPVLQRAAKSDLMSLTAVQRYRALTGAERTEFNQLKVLNSQMKTFDGVLTKTSIVTGSYSAVMDVKLAYASFRTGDIGAGGVASLAAIDNATSAGLATLTTVGADKLSGRLNPIGDTIGVTKSLADSASKFGTALGTGDKWTFDKVLAAGASGSELIGKSAAGGAGYLLGGTKGAKLATDGADFLIKGGVALGDKFTDTKFFKKVSDPWLHIDTNERLSAVADKRIAELKASNISVASLKTDNITEKRIEATALPKQTATKPNATGGSAAPAATTSVKINPEQLKVTSKSAPSGGTSNNSAVSTTSGNVKPASVGGGSSAGKSTGAATTTAATTSTPTNISLSSPPPGGGGATAKPASGSTSSATGTAKTNHSVSTTKPAAGTTSNVSNVSSTTSHSTTSSGTTAATGAARTTTSSSGPAAAKPAAGTTSNVSNVSSTTSSHATSTPSTTTRTAPSVSSTAASSAAGKAASTSASTAASSSAGKAASGAASNVASTSAGKAAAGAASNAASGAAGKAASTAASNAASGAASKAASAAASNAASSAASKAASSAASNAAGRAASNAASNAAGRAASSAASNAASSAAGRAAQNVRVPSDIRLKRDIVALARTDSGLQLYRYRYIGEATHYVGVMAQEVARQVPAAVHRRADGYLEVDYGRLNLDFLTFAEWSRRQAFPR